MLGLFIHSLLAVAIMVNEDYRGVLRRFKSVTERRRTIILLRRLGQDRCIHVWLCENWLLNLWWVLGHGGVDYVVDCLDGGLHALDLSLRRLR